MAEQIPRETQARITMKTRPDCDKPDDRLMTGFTAWFSATIYYENAMKYADKITNAELWLQ